jgi:hypothetical protein
MPGDRVETRNLPIQAEHVIREINMTDKNIVNSVALDEPADNTSPPGLEVVEFSEEEGETEWADSVFVQDFTDSILETTPSELK